MISFRHERRMDGNVVGKFYQLRKVDLLHTRRNRDVLRNKGIVGQHLEAESLRLGSNQARNSAKTHQSQDTSPEAMNRGDGTHLPAARVHARVRERNLSD